MANFFSASTIPPTEENKTLSTQIMESFSFRKLLGYNVVMTEKLNQEQSQSILDNYSVGKIVSVLALADVLVNSKKNVNLSRCLVETNQGLYIIAYAPNDELHSLWWSSESKDFAATLSAALKLKNAKILQTNQNTNTVHKFDLRVSVFAL